MNDAFQSAKKLLLSKYKNVEEYPLYSKMIGTINQSVESCDDIFAQYLLEVAKVTNAEFFLTVSKFVIIYRECLNKYGWFKYFQITSSQTESGSGSEEDKTIPKVKKQNQQITLTKEQRNAIKEEYCIMNNAEFAPEVINELVAFYLPDHNCGIPVTDCTNLIVNLCGWLLSSGYTCTKISLIKK
jgi:hypothetical protein